MPINKATSTKISVVKNPELAQLFTSDEDPDTIFVDQREIGHGSFGAVYYVRKVHLDQFLVALIWAPQHVFSVLNLGITLL